jgi:hypothetical protein
MLNADRNLDWHRTQKLPHEPGCDVLRAASRTLRKHAAYLQALSELRAQGDYPEPGELPTKALSWSRHELLSTADWLDYRADMTEVP